MNLKECMKTLESLGTAQNRKVYARHGFPEPMFGVSWANFGKLKKQIKTDHDLALKLWATGNTDARLLATMVVDPEKMKASDVDAWAKHINCYAVADAFSGVVKRTPHVMSRMKKWTKSRGEWTLTAGWNLVTNLAMVDDSLDDAFFEDRLAEIERIIHTAPNRARYAMNNTLINIGIRNKNLEKKAIAAAKRIGKVEVDHGETNCNTPDAASYIAKTLAHRAKKKKTKKKAGGKKAISRA